MKTLHVFTVPWRKSSHSGTTGGQCVEVAAVHQMAAARED
ncbi:DUF397 domain-containing protein [Actinoallomurus sp. NPDC050550]